MASAPSTLSEIASELRNVSRQLKATQRSKTNKSSGIGCPLRCHATLKAACVIFALTAPRTDVALEFLRFKRRNKSDVSEWTEAHVLRQFHEFSSVEKELMLDANDKTWGKRLTTAKAWLRDRGLRDWVTDQNKDKGVAPSNDHVWKQNISWVSGDATGALRPEKRPRWKRRQINQWVRRWATRSRVLRGTFKNGDRLSVEQMQAKALGQTLPRTKMSQGAEDADPKMSPEYGPGFSSFVCVYMIGMSVFWA